MQILDVFFEVHLQLSQFAILGIVDTGMNSWLGKGKRIVIKCLDTSMLDDSRLEQVDTLFNHIDFDQPLMTEFGIVYGIEFGSVETVHVSNIEQPIFQRRMVVQVFGTSADSATIIVSA
jgi:hypothetical protein